MSQKDLAKALGTTQTAISRLEDPSYGRISFKTFVALARVFDVAPVMRFEPTLKIFKDRWTIRQASLEVSPFEDDASTVGFVDPAPGGALYPATSTTSVGAPTVVLTTKVPQGYRLTQAEASVFIGNVKTVALDAASTAP